MFHSNCNVYVFDAYKAIFKVILNYTADYVS